MITKKALPYSLVVMAMSSTVNRVCWAAEYHPQSQDHPAYAEFLDRYNQECTNDPTIKLFENEILITIDHLIMTAPHREKQTWSTHKRTIQNRVALLKTLESETAQQIPNNRKKILLQKINLLSKLQNTYRKKDHGHKHFKNKKIAPLQELIQLDIASQDTDPHTIQANLTELATCHLADEMCKWISEQEKIVSNRLMLQKKLEEQYTPKETGRTTVYYQTRYALYQELLNTYPYPDFGEIPELLKAKVTHIQSKLSDLELAHLFENLQAENPDDYTGLVSFANTLARKFPQNKEYAQLASHYSAQFELNELVYQQERTDFTHNQNYRDFTNRIPQLKLLFSVTNQENSHAQLCLVEESIKKQKEQVDSWLYAVEHADLWDGVQAQELCTQAPRGMLPNALAHTLLTQITLTKKRETIQTISALTNLFKRELGKLNTIHPFSPHDHAKYSELADGMEEFVKEYPLSVPTACRTRKLAAYLLKEQQNDIARKTAKLQIGKRKKAPTREICAHSTPGFDHEKGKEQLKPCLHQSVCMDSIFDEKPTVHFHSNENNLQKSIEQQMFDE